MVYLWALRRGTRYMAAKMALYGPEDETETLEHTPWNGAGWGPSKDW